MLDLSKRISLLWDILESPTWSLILGKKGFLSHVIILVVPSPPKSGWGKYHDNGNSPFFTKRYIFKLLLLHSHSLVFRVCQFSGTRKIPLPPPLFWPNRLRGNRCTSLASGPCFGTCPKRCQLRVLPNRGYPGWLGDLFGILPCI